MRDIALILIFPVLIYYAIKRPYIGLALWLWSSLVPLNLWAYGFSTSFRWNLIFALTTIVSYFFSKKEFKFKSDALFTLMLIFTLQVTLSSFTHIGSENEVWREYEFFIKSIIFFVFICLIVNKPLHIEALLWACVMSIGARACIEGMKFVHSGGGHVVRSISTMFSDNNLGALASLMVIPMMIYLYTRYQHKLIKFGLGSFIFLNVMFIIGSDSRGGFLGLLVLGAYFFWKSQRKGIVLVLLIFFGLVVLQVADQNWMERMQTIENAGEDGSFMSRLIVWKLSLLLALKHPILGGGFNAVAYFPTWVVLVADFNTLSFIPSPNPSTLYVAHSIYFQVLGDTGFVGFTWYGFILLLTFTGLNKVRKNTQDEWAKTLVIYLQLSFVAFAVAGAALSAAYNSIFLFIVGLTIVLKRLYVNENNFISNKDRKRASLTNTSR